MLQLPLHQYLPANLPNGHVLEDASQLVLGPELPPLDVREDTLYLEDFVEVGFDAGAEVEDFGGVAARE